MPWSSQASPHALNGYAGKVPRWRLLLSLSLFTWRHSLHGSWGQLLRRGSRDTDEMDEKLRGLNSIGESPGEHHRLNRNIIQLWLEFIALRGVRGRKRFLECGAHSPVTMPMSVCGGRSWPAGITGESASMRKKNKRGEGVGRPEGKREWAGWMDRIGRFLFFLLCFLSYFKFQIQNWFKISNLKLNAQIKIQHEMQTLNVTLIIYCLFK